MAFDDRQEFSKEGWPMCRIRVGKKDKSTGDGKSAQLRLTIHTRDGDVYEARKSRLQAIAGALTAKGLTESAKVILRKAASAESGEAFDMCCERAGCLAPVETSRRKWGTFESFAKAYYGGELAKAFPAHHKMKKTIKDDKGKLEWISQFVGDVLLEQFTVEHALLAMKNLPPTCKKDTTRISYWQVMHRLLELAVFPAALIPHQPLLREYRPENTDDPTHYPYMFPHDDFLMLRYTGDARQDGVDLGSVVVRAFFGVCNREGGRVGEFLRRLTWAGCDRRTYKLNVGTRKNGRVGSWYAQPGTLETIWALRELVPGLAALPGPFFGLPDDDQWSPRIKELVRAAGCRPELYLPPSEGRGTLRAHDTRATFVTLCKAYDMSESYIMRRSGHEHSTMLATYNHARDDWRDGRLGKLVRLDVAIGRDELGLGPLDLAAEAAARRAAVGGDLDDDDDDFTGGAIRLESGKHETVSETERLWVVRNSVPRAWLSSMISAVPKPGVEPGRGVTPADFESAKGVHGAAAGAVTTRNPVAPSDPKAFSVSPSAAQVRQEIDPAERVLEALKTTSHAAVEAGDWALVAELGVLIDKRRGVSSAPPPVAAPVAEAEPPSSPVSSLDERRRRRGEGR
jgi:integrase